MQSDGLEMPEDEAWVIGEIFADRILNAVASKDIEAFQSDLTPRMKELLTMEIFMEMVDRFERDYGLYQKRRRACALNNPHCMPLIWVVNFDKTSLDILFQLRLVREDGKWMTDSACFRTWLI